jgi:tetratricopeptide (TPR) repeat protein
MNGADELPLDTDRVAALRARMAETEQEPQHALAVLELAVALRDADRAAEAIASARVASQLLVEQGLTVRAGRAYRLEIGLLLLLGRAAEAVAQATTARDVLADRGAGPLTLALLDAAVAEALRTIGRPQAALGRLDRARAAFAAAGHAELTVVCDHDRAVLEAELGDAPAAVDHLAAARGRFLELRDREAVAACSHNLGLGLHDLRHFNDAIEYFQEARGIFVALGRHAEAAAAFDAAVRLDPAFTRAWVNGGNAQARLGRPDEAAKRYRKALELSPRDEHARRNLAEVLRR